VTIPLPQRGASPRSLAIGIDVSARRGLHLALLADGLALRTVVHLPGAQAVVTWLALHAPDAPVGIDAPLGPRLPLLRDPATRSAVTPPPPEGRYQSYRVCDYHLARRGIGLYLSPLAESPAPTWMAAGYVLAAALRDSGRHPPRNARDHAASLLEVYPYAAFITLLGGIPPRKSTPAGRAARLRALTAVGLTGIERAESHDALDAVAAAYTTAIFVAGAGCAVGDPTEGLLALPVAEAALQDRYRRCAEPSIGAEPEGCLTFGSIG